MNYSSSKNNKNLIEKNDLDLALEEAQNFINKVKNKNNENNLNDLLHNNNNNSNINNYINYSSNKNIKKSSSSKEKSYESNKNKKTYLNNNNININNKNIYNNIDSNLSPKNNNILIKSKRFVNTSSKFEISETNKKLLLAYKKQLKTFQFTEFNNIEFNSNEDAELFFKFLDEVLYNKSNTLQEKKYLNNIVNNLKRQNEVLTTEKNTLDKEIKKLIEQNKIQNKEQKNTENKNIEHCNKLEKDLAMLNSKFNKLTSKCKQILIEKQNITDKYNKLSEVYNKMQININSSNYNTLINSKYKSNILSNANIVSTEINDNNTQSKASFYYNSLNNFEITEKLKRTSLLNKMSLINGSEILIQTFKNGYHDALRELVYEISSLKDFLKEINTEILQAIENNFKENNYNNLINMENMRIYISKNSIKQDLLCLSFLDSRNEFKKIIFNGISYLCSLIDSFKTKYCKSKNISENYNYNVSEDANIDIDNSNSKKSIFKKHIVVNKSKKVNILEKNILEEDDIMHLQTNIHQNNNNNNNYILNNSHKLNSNINYDIEDDFDKLNLESLKSNWINKIKKSEDNE